LVWASKADPQAREQILPYRTNAVFGGLRAGVCRITEPRFAWLRRQAPARGSDTASRYSAALRVAPRPEAQLSDEFGVSPRLLTATRDRQDGIDVETCLQMVREGIEYLLDAILIGEPGEGAECTELGESERAGRE
jgi:hypothetical protein